MSLQLETVANQLAAELVCNYRDRCHVNYSMRYFIQASFNKLPREDAFKGVYLPLTTRILSTKKQVVATESPKIKLLKLSI